MCDIEIGYDPGKFGGPKAAEPYLVKCEGGVAARAADQIAAERAGGTHCEEHHGPHEPVLIKAYEDGAMRLRHPVLGEEFTVSWRYGNLGPRLVVSCNWAPEYWVTRYYCPGHDGGVCQYGMCDEIRYTGPLPAGADFPVIPAGQVAAGVAEDWRRLTGR